MSIVFPLGRSDLPDDIKIVQRGTISNILFPCGKDERTQKGKIRFRLLKTVSVFRCFVFVDEPLGTRPPACWITTGRPRDA